MHEIGSIYTTMKYAIIAAGEGSRLAQEGVELPKPLVKVNGEPLIDRLIRIFMDNDAEEIDVICNDRTTLVSQHLARLQEDGLNGRRIPLKFMVKSTPSSMHSLYEISKWLGDAPFVLTTVDTIFKEWEFEEYIEDFKALLSKDKKDLWNNSDGLMAVTDYIDDEKPLYVSTDEKFGITGFHDEQNGCRYVSGGIYGLTPKSLQTLQRCIERGESRMRNFQRAMISEGMYLTACPFGKILDIDHKDDIRKAEDFLKDDCYAIYRAERFSPNSIERDKAIMDAVCEKLSKYYNIVNCDEDDFARAEIWLTGTESFISMARSRKALNKLMMVEEGANTIVNKPSAVFAMSRINIDRLLRENDIPCAPLSGNDGWWIKRGDETAQSKEDVVFAASDKEKDDAIARFKERGISNIVVTAHVKGDLVKFYGVNGTDFFNVSYPTDGTFSKFGNEKLNGKAQHTPFDKGYLHEQATKLATLTGIDVYGGDCIVREDGSLAIIDFNDWPSFSCCREEAAEAIANLVVERNVARNIN